MKKIDLKGLLVSYLFLLAFNIGFSQGQQVKRPFGTTTSNFGYLEYLPANYTTNSVYKFPLIVFLHGINEAGDGSATDLDLVDDFGIPAIIAGNVKDEVWPVEDPDGNVASEDFVVLSPQSSNGFPIPSQVRTFINYAINHYNVDPRRVYLTGISIGSTCVWRYLTTYQDQVAAASPIAGDGHLLLDKACNISGIPVRVFHGLRDTDIDYQNEVAIVDAINACVPTPSPLAKITIFGTVYHNAWGNAYGLEFRPYNTSYDPYDMSLYEWFLQYSKTNTNMPPTRLRVIRESGTQIELTWDDNSSNENGFEIYRKALPDGNTRLIYTTSSNDTTYTDNNVTQGGSSYEYKVRALSASGYSEFTNSVIGSRVEFELWVNINITSIDPNDDANWNNTNSSPTSGLLFSNLHKSDGSSSPVDLRLTSFGTGSYNSTGAVTGNNLGVYKDAIIVGSYSYKLEEADGGWRLEGLDPGYAYNITFFSSVTSSALNALSADGITEYEINNKKQRLDARDNSTETVTFFNVKPDQDNSITIKVRAANIGGSNYGILNAMVIQAYQTVDLGPGENFYTYYSQDNTDVSQPANWNTRSDGTGYPLGSGFYGDGMTYIMKESPAVQISQTWKVSGSGTMVDISANTSVTIADAADSVTLSGVSVDPSSVIQFISNSPKSIIIGAGGLSIGDSAEFNIGKNDLTVIMAGAR